MKKLVYILFLLAGCSLSAQDIGGQWYVAPADSGGNDSNAGTYAAPFATFEKATDTVSAGDTVYFIGGTYHFDSPVRIDTVEGGYGTADNWVYYWGYPGDSVVFDFATYDAEPNYSGNSYATALFLYYKTGFVHFKDFEIKNVWQHDSLTEVTAIRTLFAHNLIFENITVDSCGGRGILHQTGGTKYINEYDTTLFYNCDVFQCADSLPYTASAIGKEGNQADGFKSYGEPGAHITFRGCRSWNNSDDGFDAGGWNCTIYDSCWTFNNGYLPGGDGDGVKTGGAPTAHMSTYPELVASEWQDSVNRYITNCISAGNSNNGYHLLEYNGYLRTNGRVYNNVAYQVGAFGWQISTNSGDDSIRWVFRNNWAYDLGNVIPSWNFPVAASYMNYTESHNNWDDVGGYPGYVWTDTITVDSSDFQSLDIELLKSPRQSDGSLPVIAFAFPVDSSDLVDAGTTIPNADSSYWSATYDGLAPDIGVFEYPTNPNITEVDSIHVAGTGGATTITVDNGTLQMLDTIWPEDADFQNVTWSVIPGTGTATIDQDGLLRAVTDGTVAVRATAQDGSGVYGEDTITLSNQTEPTVPVVITSLSSDIRSIQGTSGGTVTDSSGATVTARGVCWSTSENPTINDSKTVDGSGIGSFTSTVTGLHNSTRYYIRAYATNSEGTGYGDNRQINTTAYSTARRNNKTYRLNGKAVVH